MDSHPALITLNGAIVGGPDQSDNYPDIRNDYQRSEVAYDYNAGFTGAAAGLTQAGLNGFAFASCGGSSGEVARSQGRLRVPHVSVVAPMYACMYGVCKLL